jgi:hypothetical protein
VAGATLVHLNVGLYRTGKAQAIRQQPVDQSRQPAVPPAPFIRYDIAKHRIALEESCQT